MSIADWPRCCEGLAKPSRCPDGDAGSRLALWVGAYFPVLSFGRHGVSPGPRGCGAGQALRPEDGGAGGSQRCRRGGMAAAAPGTTCLDAIGHLGGGDSDQARRRSLTRDPWQGARFATEPGCLVAKSCLTAIPWTVVRQFPLSMGFPRQEYWSGLPSPSPGDLPCPGIEQTSTLQVDSLSLSHLGNHRA